MWTDICVVLTKILSDVTVMFEAKIDRTASNGFTEFLSLFETNLMPNRKAIELLLQLKRAKAHGKNLHESETTPGPPSFG